jgi:hypothetical protein
MYEYSAPTTGLLDIKQPRIRMMISEKKFLQGNSSYIFYSFLALTDEA